MLTIRAVVDIKESQILTKQLEFVLIDSQMLIIRAVFDKKKVRR